MIMTMLSFTSHNKLFVLICSASCIIQVAPKLSPVKTQENAKFLSNSNYICHEQHNN